VIAAAIVPVPPEIRALAYGCAWRLATEWQCWIEVDEIDFCERVIAAGENAISWDDARRLHMMFRHYAGARA
jgi:hypothetical protein